MSWKSAVRGWRARRRIEQRLSTRFLRCRGAHGAFNVLGISQNWVAAILAHRQCLHVARICVDQRSPRRYAGPHTIQSTNVGRTHACGGGDCYFRIRLHALVRQASYAKTVSRLSTSSGPSLR
jgi:hypothetical protein